MKTPKEKNVQVIGVESIDKDMEKFQLNIKGLPVELILSRTRQQKTFKILMNAIRNNIKLNNDVVFKEMNEQFKSG